MYLSLPLMPLSADVLIPEFGEKTFSNKHMHVPVLPSSIENSEEMNTGDHKVSTIYLKV